MLALGLCTACGGGAEKKPGDGEKEADGADPGPVEAPRVNADSRDPRENPMAEPD